MSLGLPAQTARHCSRPLSLVVRRMLTRTIIFWLGSFATVSVLMSVSLLNDPNVRVVPGTFERSDIILGALPLIAAYTALLSVSYLIGMSLSKVRPNFVTSLQAGVSLAVTLALLARLLLLIETYPYLINVITLSLGVATAAAIPWLTFVKRGGRA